MVAIKEDETNDAHGGNESINEPRKFGKCSLYGAQELVSIVYWNNQLIFQINELTINARQNKTNVKS